MKICSKCKEQQELTAFPKDRSKRDGLHPVCRLCHSLAHKHWRANDPERVLKQRARSAAYRRDHPEKNKAGIRRVHLRTKYGMTEQDFEDLLLSQNGQCAICGSTDSKVKGRMHVDHDHLTGKVRGILCQACNVTLGKMEDSPELLRKAADYLEKALSKS